MSFNTARTGRRPMRSQGLVEIFKWEIGDRFRVALPIVNGDIVIFGSPIHQVAGRGRVRMLRRDGSTYPINTVRCTHPYSQATTEEQVKLAQRGEMCVWCEIERLERRRQWAVIEEEFGEDGFSKLTKEEQREFYAKMDKEYPNTVESSYFREEDEDGNTYNRTTLELNLLLLQFKLDEKGKPVMNDKGFPDYEPVLMPVSANRLDKFYQAVVNAKASGILDEDNVHTVDVEGEEATDSIGWIDFLMSFPRESSKMESGRNLSISVMAPAQSVISTELIEDFKSKETEVMKSSEGLVKNVFKNLTPHTRSEALEMLYVDDMTGSEYLEELKSKYKLEDREEDGKIIKGDDTRDKEVFETVLQFANKGADEDEEETEKADEPKAEPTAKKPTKAELEKQKLAKLKELSKAKEELDDNPFEV